MSQPPLSVPEIAQDNRVLGKTAIVTGGGSAGEMGGTGSDIAILLAAKGANVVVLDIDEDRIAHTMEAIDRLGGHASPFVADITDTEACVASATFAANTYGGVDILVNNAAIAPGEQENLRSTWDAVLAINLTAAKTMSDAVLPYMEAAGNGSIVHISSVSAFAAGGGMAYTAAKHGMVGLAKAQAYEYGPRGIRANSVAPGHVAIPMGLSFKGWEGSGTDVMRKRRAKASLLGTEGTGWDVAYAVLFLASDESSYITGHTIPVDGGTLQVFPIVMSETIESA
jgi:NAD(P)-dependent dehydrogenase (short-subunit alcohol dehydrogenase family)